MKEIGPDVEEGIQMYCAVMTDASDGDLPPADRSDRPRDRAGDGSGAGVGVGVDDAAGPEREPSGKGPAEDPEKRGPDELRPRSWSRTIDYGIFAVFAVQCVLTAVAAFVSLPQTFAAPGAGQILAVATTVAALLAVSGVLVVTHRPRLRTTALVAVGVFTGQLWSASMTTSITTSITTAGSDPVASRSSETPWWGWQPTVTLCILVGATFVGKKLVVPVLTVALGYLVIRLLVPTDWPHVLTEIIVCVQVAVVASLIVPVWRRIGGAADAAVGRENRIRRQLAPIRVREQRERAANRVLHDEIIHTLRALATPATLSNETLKGMIANAMTRMLEKQQNHDGAGDLAAQLATTARNFTRLQVHFVSGGPLNVDSDVVRALTGAASEALRNVERHSGTTAATVELTGNPEALTIAITDTGRGFDVDEHRPGSFGLRWTIGQQVVDVGGDVEVDSAPDRGTSIRISWSAGVGSRSASASIDGLVDLAGLRVPLIAAIAVPQTVGGLLQSLVQGPTTALPAMSTFAALLAAGLTIFTLLFHLADRVTGRLSAALCLGAILVAAMAGVALDPADRAGLGYYPMDLVAPMLLIVALMRPRWESLATAAAVGAIGAWMASRTELGISGYLPAVFLCPVSALLILLIRKFVDHLAIGTQRSEERGRLLWDERIRASEERRGRVEQLERVIPLVLPFLQQLQAQSPMVISPAVARRAQLLEVAVRDQLAVGKALRTQTQQRILRARLDGCSIQINASPMSLPAGVSLRTATDTSDAGTAAGTAAVTSADSDSDSDSNSNSDAGQVIDEVVNLLLQDRIQLDSMVVSVSVNPLGIEVVSALIRPATIPPSVHEHPFGESDSWLVTDSFALLRVEIPVAGDPRRIGSSR